MGVSFPAGTSMPVGRRSTPAPGAESPPRNTGRLTPAIADGSESLSRRTSESRSMSPLRSALPAPLFGAALHGGDLATLRTPYEREATELHRPLTSGANAALVEHVKHLPYYCEKPDRTTRENLNGEASFGPEGKSKEIVCRHLALAWALQIEATGKPDYTALRDVGSIQRSVPFELDAQIEHLQQAGTDSHIVAASDWGRFIADQLRSLEATGGIGAKRMIVTSDDHVMALELKVKRAPSGVRYVANFYDPNLTAAHKRVAGPDLQSFEALGLADVGVSKEFKTYFDGWPAAFVVGVPPGGAAAIPLPKPGGDPERRLAGPVPPLDVPVMHYLMAQGFAGTLRDILPSFVALVKDDPPLAEHLLSAESKGLDMTGLQVALEKGNVQVIHALRALAEAVSLPDVALESLLAARESGDTPSLTMAMWTGAADALHAFIKWVADSGLPADRQVELLAARDSHGMAGVESAMSKGHSGAVRAFIDGVAASALPTAEQLTLFDARRSPSEPPVLFQAMRAGKVKTVQAYFDGIQAHPTLSTDDKVKLLSMGAEDGAHVLRLGLKHGAPDTIAALVDGMTRLGLGAADQCTLLRGTDQWRMPALADAMLSGAADNVGAFAGAVLASSLSNADKVDVLKMGRWGANPLNSPAAREAYQQAVRDSSLPPAAQELLLVDLMPANRRSRRSDPLRKLEFGQFAPGVSQYVTAS